MSRRGHALQRLNKLRKTAKELSINSKTKLKIDKYSKEGEIRKEIARLNKVKNVRTKIEKVVKKKVLVQYEKIDPVKIARELSNQKEIKKLQKRERVKQARMSILDELPFIGEEQSPFDSEIPKYVDGAYSLYFNGDYRNVFDDVVNFKSKLLGLLPDGNYTVLLDGINVIEKFPFLKVSGNKINQVGNLLKTLINIYENIDSGNRSQSPFNVVFTPTVVESQPLPLSRDGVYNCAILPVVFHLKSLGDNAKNKGKINKLMKLNNNLKDGANEQDLQTICNISSFRLCINDKYSEWKTFSPMNKNGKLKNVIKTLLLEHTNNHLKGYTEEILKRIKDENDLKYYVKEYKNNKNLLNDFADKEIEFVDNIKEYETKFLCSRIIKNKDNKILAVLGDKIYKSKFDEYEKYPEAFGDGGVGKEKFLSQHENYRFYKPNTFDKLLLKSDIRSFYLRSGKSKATHHKYDMNISYQSVNKYIDYPIIEAQFKISGNVSDIMENPEYIDIKNSHSLIYIVMDYKVKKYGGSENYHVNLNYIKNKNKLYYDNSGWYPIEIVKKYYNAGINPKIRNVLYATKTFKIDDSKFTKSQFRSFVGKTYCSKTADIWQTTDVGEFLQARFKLQNKITRIDIRKLEDGKILYEIQYIKDELPWSVPIIYTMILRWQKYIMFEQYNKLIDSDILPVYICVDCIEIPNKRDDLFDIGPNMGQWKKEKINLSLPQTEKLLEYETSYYNDTLDLNEYKPLKQLTHIEGPAGYGKSRYIIELAKSYPDFGYCATTHQASEELNKESIKLLGKSIGAETYYKMFNILNGNKPVDKSGYFIEECSMLSGEHLSAIEKKLRNAFNPKLPYGGKFIILVGDFEQLPVVEGTPINETNLYKSFYRFKLETNWRQKDDKKFAELCNKLRGEIDIKEVSEIVDMLNKRVKPIPCYARNEDIYIAGINKQVDNINKKYKFDIGAKVISNETFIDQKDNKIANGAKGILIYISDDIIQIEWKDGSISTIKARQKNKLSLGYAITIHKCQGATYSGNVVIDPSRMFEQGHLYVAISRAKTFKNIYLTEPITYDIISMTCKIE